MVTIEDFKHLSNEQKLSLLDSDGHYLFTNPKSNEYSSPINIFSLYDFWVEESFSIDKRTIWAVNEKPRLTLISSGTVCIKNANPNFLKLKEDYSEVIKRFLKASLIFLSILIVTSLAFFFYPNTATRFIFYLTSGLFSFAYSYPLFKNIIFPIIISVLEFVKMVIFGIQYLIDNLYYALYLLFTLGDIP